MKTRKHTHIAFLLDETGSMGSIAVETISGFNRFLEDQQAEVNDEVRVTMSLTTFDSIQIRKRYKKTDVMDVARLNADTYRPGASTPLIDAAYEMLEDTAKVAKKIAPDEIVVVIQTDGEENASTKHKSEQLAKLVKKSEKKGWKFLFIGAGLDAFQVANRAGITLARESVMSYRRGRSEKAFEATSLMVADLVGERQFSMAYSRAMREAAGDDFHEDQEPSEDDA